MNGYYCWRKRPPSARSVRHAMLAEVIREVHDASRQTYGARRVHAELVLGRGLTVPRCTVELVMQRHGLAGLPGRPRYRKIPNVPTASDLVERQFQRDQPNQLWVTDITEHLTREGRVFCCVVLDAWSRKVVGWSIDRRPTTAMVNSALGMAVARLQTGVPPESSLTAAGLAARQSFDFRTADPVLGCGEPGMPRALTAASPTKAGKRTPAFCRQRNAAPARRPARRGAPRSQHRQPWQFACLRL